MDSYTEDVHPQSKGFLTDLSTNKLSSLEQDTEEAQPHFEPLEVQLRFELGSLVDTHVLIDTDGPRESHWDFMRQEQGRFQQSSEDNNVLLSHGKRDESFISCEDWPRSRNQVDTRIFIDAQDDVRMITEAFAGKDKSVVDVVEDDRGFLVTSINRQCKEETSWSRGNKQALGKKALESSREDFVEGTVDVSQISIVKSDSRVDGKNRSEYSESQHALMEAHKENNKADFPAANVSKELSPCTKGTHEAEAIPESLTVSKSQSTMKVVSSKDGNHDQEGLLEFECSKRCVVETIKSGFSNADNLEKHVNPNELQADDVELLCVSEGNLKMDIASLKERAETSVDKKMFQTSDLAGTVDNHLVQKATLADEPQGLSLEAVSQPLSLDVETHTVRDTDKSIVILGGSCLDSKPGGSSPEAVSVSADGPEKQNGLTVHCSGISSKLQETQAIGTDSVPVSENSVETAALSILEGSPKQNVAGNSLDKETEVLHEINDFAGKTSDVNRQVTSSLSASELPHNILSSATIAATVPAEGDGVCLAACVLEHTDSYEPWTERLGNNNPVMGLEKAGVMQGSSAAAKFGMAETCPSHIETTRGELQASKAVCVSGCHCELEAADNRVSHEHAMETIVDPRHSSESSIDLSNVVESSQQSLEKHFMAHNVHDDVREETVGNDKSKLQLQEQKIEQPTTHKNAIESSPCSSKPLLSDDSKFIKDTSHAGGTLHVLLDVHKEGIIDNSPLKNTSAQEHLHTIEHEGCQDAQVSNPHDTTGQEYEICGAKVAVGCSDSNVSGSVAQVALEVAHKDLSPIQKNSEKSKADLSVPNNRLKDSPRPSPIQLLGDEEQRNGGAEVSGRRKATPKSTSQKKGMKSIENLTSPKNSGSKGLSRSKKLLSPIVQERGKEISQMPAASIDKTVFPGNVRHHVLSDINGLEIAVPLSSQPFSEPQQVQLRAQILVYGSLIQGAAPEETLMVAAFSNVGGGHIEKAIELSERAIWEKQWQAAVDRIRPKSSRDSFIARANLALVANSPAATARAAEGGSKPNGSSVMTSAVMSNNRPTGLLARPLDVSGTKGQDTRVRQHTDSVHDISVSSHQAIAAATPLGSVTATASRAVSSMLTESQTPRTRMDSQLMTPQTYFPVPSLGPFITGVPQWFSNTAFPGSWMLQNQNTPHANPSLLTHAHSAAILGQTSCSSGTVMPANTSSTTLFTPVVGSLSVTPTPVGDPLPTTKQAASESRPRKRKKTESDYGSSTDMNISHAIEFTPATSTQSQMQTGLACSGITNPVHSPLPPAPETLAVIVASTQLSKSTQDMSLAAVPVDKILVSGSNNMPSVNVSSARNFCSNSIDLRTSADHLSQAQAGAEEAASAAASALIESELVWSQLKAQKGSGSISDTEALLVSSAIAVATAASVAKAAAAAAKIAFEAAAQAKRMSEKVLEAGKQASEGSKLLADKAESTSQMCGMPESFSSILTAAKMASKKRLEAVSAARARADNFESVVRAAELAANSITQVGSVMAMGESVPFTLDMLLEVGPEGLLRLEDKTRTKTKGMALRLPPASGTPKSLDRENKFPFKISSIDEVASQGDAQMDSWASESIMATRPESDIRINTELGVELVTDFNKQKAVDHLSLSTTTSKQGLLTTRTENGLTEQDILVADDQFLKGSLVEVMSDEKGLHGVWFSARVQSLDEEKVFVLYDDLLADDGYSPLEEWIQITGSSGEAPRVRLAHPNTHIGFEGTRKRRREAMGSHKWFVGDRVDAWIRDGWWEGEIQEIIEDGESKAKIYFPGDGDTSIVKTSKLRPSLVWNYGHWVLWNDVKKESSRGRIDILEGDTPFAKRQKSEKVQASLMKQKLMPGSSADISAIHIEAIPFDSNIANLATDFKGLAAEGIPKARLQASKIVFGIPRPTKKRKLIEVSKHFGSAKGVLGAGALEAKASNNSKTENDSMFVSGPPDTGTTDVSKAKKRIFYQPKAQPKKDTSTDVNANGKKERTVLSSKTILRKNSSNKGELPMLFKNKEGYSMKKKNILSENNQFESRERSEGRTFCSKVESHPQSISFTDINKESSLATQDDERQTDVGHESGRDISQAKDNTTSGNQTSTNRASNKEKAKRLVQQAKKGDIKSSAPASSKEVASQSTKKREYSPSKDNEKTVRKGTESQPNQEGEKKPEAPGKKQSANPLINGEKQYTHSTKESEKDKEVGKPVPETWEPRRTSRKIQPTSKLLEGLQTAPKLGKNSSSHDRGHKGASKAPSHV